MDDKITVRDSFQNVGRGQVIICNHDERLHTGMKLTVRGVKYEITGIETWIKTVDPPVPGEWMAIVLRPNEQSKKIEIGDEIEILNPADK